MEIRKIIREEIDDFSDFEWAKGEIEYPIDSIDFLIGKKAYFRENNMDEVLETRKCTRLDLNKSDLNLGKIKSNIGWTIKKSNLLGGTTLSIVLDDKKGTQHWDVDDVLELVRLGIWVVEGDDGKFINESEELDWIKDINPELSNENFHLFYNKPFYWYHQGKPVSDLDAPRVYWFEESAIHVRGEDEIALLCYKEKRWDTSEPKDDCTDIFHSTAIRYIKKGTLQHQPQLSDIKECEHYLDKIVNNVTLINEDGRKPDMEWDFTKNNLDKSKKWVKTKEDVKKYLSLLFNKLKNLPRKIKVKIIKYVLASFIGLLTVNQLQTVVDEVSPEKIEITKIQQPEIQQPEKEESKVESIRKPSEELFTFLKKEEGYVSKGYKIGDGKITIGWGHAEDINNSKYKLGQEIDTTEAKILLKQDVKEASEALNRILNGWESKGIKVNVTQDMYNTMTSMIFNMGISNFRKSDFIQLVKKNKLDKAKEKIKTTSSHLFSGFPGLKKRRELESGNFNITSS